MPAFNSPAQLKQAVSEAGGISDALMSKLSALPPSVEGAGAAPYAAALEIIQELLQVRGRKRDQPNWAAAVQRLAKAGPSTELRLEKAVAFKASIGPLAMNTFLCEKQLESRIAMQRTPSFHQLDAGLQTKIHWEVQRLQKEIAANNEEMKKAEMRFAQMRVESSKVMSESVGASALAYADVMERIDPDGSKRARLRDACAARVNVTALAPGTVVQIVENGQLTKARIEGIVGGNAQASGGAEVQFTDTEGDVSTLKVVGGKLQWWSGGKCYAPHLMHIAWTLHKGYETIYTKQNQQLVSHLVKPAAGPKREALKRDLARLGLGAGTKLEGFGDVAAKVAAEAAASAAAAAGGDVKDLQYRCLLWHEWAMMGVQYEKGFDTSVKARHLRTVPRVNIYANLKQRQAAPAGCSADSTSLEYLTMLFAEADRANELLVATGKRIVAAVNAKLGRADAVHAKNAPLKALKRVQEKTAEKYAGDYGRLTDLARMTYECDTLEAVELVVAALVADEAWSLVLIKDRLMAEFDPFESGGYRDLLINMKSVKTNHIVEMQVTLRGLLEVKNGGGHAAYKLARILDLNAKETTHHSGALNPDVIERIASGMIRNLRIEGGGNNLAQHFDELSRALAAPTCLINYIWHVSEWPKGKQIADLYTPAVFRQLAPRLEMFTCGLNPDICGALPAELWECRRLVDLRLCQTNIEYTLDRLGELPRLENLIVWRCPRLTGNFPASIGGLSRLSWVQVFECSMSGNLPIDAFTPIIARNKAKGADLQGGGGIRAEGQKNGPGFSNAAEAQQQLDPSKRIAMFVR